MQWLVKLHGAGVFPPRPPGAGAGGRPAAERTVEASRSTRPVRFARRLLVDRCFVSYQLVFLFSVSTRIDRSAARRARHRAAASAGAGIEVARARSRLGARDAVAREVARRGRLSTAAARGGGRREAGGRENGRAEQEHQTGQIRKT